MLRTHHCGALRTSHIGEQVTLCGWLQRRRDKGKLLWLELRDSYGITQLVLEEGQCSHALLKQARELGREDVLQVKGKVVARSAPNTKLASGAIEVQVESLHLLNPANQPPFLIETQTDGQEELRMRYRYLDLRRPPLQRALQLRAQVAQQTRAYLDGQGFLEIATPTLIKSTPEGARDFLVSARQQQGHYYALPQSPQLLKQLLMVGGVDRYYQLARCFRDEDLRADRQPEFTQIDCELAFVQQQDVLALCEGLLRHLFLTIKGEQLPPFQRMSYAEAMSCYGTDKPDLRWGMRLFDLRPLVPFRGLQMWDDSQAVMGLCVKGGASYTRKQLDRLKAFAAELDPDLASLVAVAWQADGSLRTSVSRWYDEAAQRAWLQKVGGSQGDLLLILSGSQAATPIALGALGRYITSIHTLTPIAPFMPLWITNFPLLAFDSEKGSYESLHHPFTAPRQADEPLLESTPGRVKAQAYDVVINGVELGGGSIRIHRAQLQHKVLSLMGMSNAEIEKQFGFLMEALTYGAPPHGGIALGLERLCMVLDGGSSIRDYIAFPKNNAGRDTMLGAPAPLH